MLQMTVPRPCPLLQHFLQVLAALRDRNVASVPRFVGYRATPENAQWERIELVFSCYTDLGGSAFIAKVNRARDIEQLAFYGQILSAYREIERAGVLINVDFYAIAYDAAPARTLQLIPDITNSLFTDPTQTGGAMPRAVYYPAAQVKENGALTNLLSLAFFILDVEFCRLMRCSLEDYQRISSLEMALEGGGYRIAFPRGPDGMPLSRNARSSFEALTHRTPFYNFMFEYVMNGAKPLGDFDYLSTNIEWHLRRLRSAERPRTRRRRLRCVSCYIS